MKHNYLLEEIDSLVVSKKINSIIEKMNFQEAIQSTYDIEEQELSVALEDLDTYSFLSPKKVIIIKNVFSNNNDEDMKHLLKYIDNPNCDNLLFLTCKKLDNRLNIIKQLKNNSNIDIIQFDIDPYKYVKELLNGYKISNRSIQLLIDKCKNDLTKIRNECDKLILFKSDNLEIIEDDINNLVVEKLGDSSEVLFSFVKYLLLKDKKHAIEEYQELLNYDMDVYSIIGLIASQLRLMYQVKLLKDKNLSVEEITKKLFLKSTYQVKKMSQYSYNYSFLELSNLIDVVASIDFKIKSGRIEPKLAMDILIINI